VGIKNQLYGLVYQYRVGYSITSYQFHKTIVAFVAAFIIQRKQPFQKRTPSVAVPAKF